MWGENALRSWIYPSIKSFENLEIASSKSQAEYKCGQVFVLYVAEGCSRIHSELCAVW
jgi:hypothetical protein